VGKELRRDEGRKGRVRRGREVVQGRVELDGRSHREDAGRDRVYGATIIFVVVICIKWEKAQSALALERRTRDERGLTLVHDFNTEVANSKIPVTAETLSSNDVGGASTAEDLAYFARREGERTTSALGHDASKRSSSQSTGLTHHISCSDASSDIL
jgi:hypothetical protein